MQQDYWPQQLPEKERGRGGEVERERGNGGRKGGKERERGEEVKRGREAMVEGGREGEGERG